MAIHEASENCLELWCDPDYTRDIWKDSYDPAKLRAGVPWKECSTVHCEMSCWMAKNMHMTVGEMATAMGQFVAQWSAKMRVAAKDYISQEVKDIFTNNVVKDPAHCRFLHDHCDDLSPQEKALMAEHMGPPPN